MKLALAAEITSLDKDNRLSSESGICFLFGNMVYLYVPGANKYYREALVKTTVEHLNCVDKRSEKEFTPGFIGSFIQTNKFTVTLSGKSTSRDEQKNWITEEGVELVNLFQFKENEFLEIFEKRKYK